MKKILYLLLLLAISITIAACKPPAVAPPEHESSVAMTLVVGNSRLTANIATNIAADVLVDLLPLSVTMSDLNANEKYFYLSQSLPTQSESVQSVKAGDIMLYGDNCLVIFYKSFHTTYKYTRIATINNPASLAATLGSTDIAVTFFIENKQ